MISAAVLLAILVASYLACARPRWFWTSYIACPSVLAILLGWLPGYSSNGIPIGPLLLRDTDPASIGLLLGVLYHTRYSGLRLLRNHAGGAIERVILFFLLLKVLYTVLLGSDLIAANVVVSHVAEGLVAALGDLRDSLFPLVVPLYVYTVRSSCRLQQLGWPLFIASAIIVCKGLVLIAATGSIWSNDAAFRFINSEEAIDLTIVAIVLLFVPIPRLSSGMQRAYVALILSFALVANHRSQWIAAVAAAAVLALISVAGPPLLGNEKRNRVLASGLLLATTAAAMAITSLGEAGDKYPALATLNVRLYAITNPSRDADSKWREALWRDRVTQVGEDWPWGRVLGDRRATLYHGKWLDVPDHSAYVTVYELGGVVLCILVALFWGRIIQVAVVRLMSRPTPRGAQTAAMSLAVAAGSLTFGTAYNFPLIGPAFALMLALNL